MASTLKQTHQSHMTEITGDQFQSLSDRLDNVVAEIRALRDTIHAGAPAKPAVLASGAPWTPSVPAAPPVPLSGSPSPPPVSKPPIATPAPAPAPKPAPTTAPGGPMTFGEPFEPNKPAPMLGGAPPKAP